MLLDGLTFLDSSTAENLAVQRGNALPTTGNNVGELFYLIGTGLHAFNGTAWVLVESTAGEVEPFTGGYVPNPTEFGSAVTLNNSLKSGSSSVISDSSSNGAVATISGTVTQTTATVPVADAGFGSLSFDGSSHLSFAPNAGYQVGTGDFTIDGWFRAASFGSNFAIYQSEASTSGSANALYLFANANGIVLGQHGGGSPSYEFGTSLTTGTWYHFRVARLGATTYGFINGTLISTTAAFSGTNFGGSGALVGYIITPMRANGLISNLRVVKGTALSTSNFTVPATPSTAVAGTSLLLHGRAASTGTAGQVLTSTGDATAPLWQTIPSPSFSGGTVSGSTTFSSDVSVDGATTLGGTTTFNGRTIFSGGTGGSITAPAISFGNNKFLTFSGSGAHPGTDGFIWITSSNELVFGTANTPRFAITGSGAWSIGTSAAPATNFGTSGQVLTSQGDAPPTWAAAPASSSLAGGAAGQIPYQSGAGSTAFSSNLTYDNSTRALIVGTTGAAKIQTADAATPYGLTIKVGNGTGNMPGLEILGGDTSNSGGAGWVNVYGGNGTGSQTQGGGVTVRGGYTLGTGTAGTAVVSGGQSTSGTHGSVILGTFQSGGSAFVERLHISPTGAWGLGSASGYGTSGQVLTSNGNAAPTWTSISSGWNGGTVTSAVTITSAVPQLTLGTTTVPARITAAASSAAGNLFEILGSTASGTGVGGNINITAGAAAGTNQNGGTVTISGGANTGTGETGYAVLKSGAATLTTNGTPGAWAAFTFEAAANPSFRFGHNGNLDGRMMVGVAGRTFSIQAYGAAANLALEGGYGSYSGQSGGNVLLRGGYFHTTGTGGYISLQTTDTSITQAVERFRVTPSGALSIGETGTGYGSTGQVLTSQGNAPPTWTTISTGWNGGSVTSAVTITSTSPQLTLGGGSGAVITTPAGSTSGAAGHGISINPGLGNSAGNSAGGGFFVNAGASYGSAAGGSVYLAGGNALGTTGAGGDLTIKSGDTNGSGAAGTVYVRGGTAWTGTPGSVNIDGGVVAVPTAGVTGGSVNITGGSNNIAGGTHGNVNINAGAAANGTSGYITFNTSSAGATRTERLRITATGAFAIGGAASYGTSGQVLTSQGNAAPTWGDVAWNGGVIANGIFIQQSTGPQLTLGVQGTGTAGITSPNGTVVGHFSINPGNTTGTGNNGAPLTIRAGGANSGSGGELTLAGGNGSTTGGGRVRIEAGNYGDIWLLTGSNVRFGINASGAFTVGGTSSFGTAGQVLISAGNAASPAWGGVPAGGSNTQVQYNSSGSLAGAATFTFDGTRLNITGRLATADATNATPSTLTVQPGTGSNANGAPLIMNGGGASATGGSATVSGGAAYHGGPLYLYGGGGTGGGNGGDVYIRSGSAIASGGGSTGKVTIAGADNASNSSGLTIGEVLIRGSDFQGQSPSTAGAVNIRGGYAPAGPGGPVTLTGGTTGGGALTGGSVTITGGLGNAQTSLGGNVIISGGQGGASSVTGGGEIVFNTASAGAVTERFRIRRTGALALSGTANVGTAGQVLTSNGDAPPTWQNAATGGPAVDSANTWTAAQTITTTAPVQLTLGSANDTGAAGIKVSDTSGDFTLTGSNRGDTGAGGAITITAGSSALAGYSAGALNLLGGSNGAADGSGGPARLTGGGTTAGSTYAGLVEVSGGNTSAASASGGSATLKGGTASGTNGVGGSVTVMGGSGTLAGGATMIRTGEHTGGDGSNNGELYIYTGATERMKLTGAGHLHPSADGTQNLGLSYLRWNNIYASTGAINNSDRNLKEQETDISAAEQAVAIAAKALLKKFKFKDAVALKGPGARWHFGIIAQDLEAAFAAEGLNAHEYGMFTVDTWYEVDGKPTYQAEGSGSVPYNASSPGAVPVTRLGVRYEELLAFIIAAL